jgi:hypothetical protein
VANASEPSSPSPHDHFERLLLDAFHAAGWKADSEAKVGSHRADILAKKGKHHYVVELKAASEGRRDRLIALLSQAILQAKFHASHAAAGAVPLAVVAAPRIPAGMARALQEFAHDHAPEVALGLMDREGLRAFVGVGLEALNAKSGAPHSSEAPAIEPSIDLFSDLNQWMLKGLLAPHIDRSELMPADFPREGYRNASELARAARVSVMSAFRFLRQLDREGFLHESRDRIRLVRIDALLERWQASNQKPARELNARWILAGAGRQLSQAIERLGKRSCVGLFAAARAMGLGHVQGVPLHIYVADFRSDNLNKAGLMKAGAGDPVDVVLRLPPARESVFRGVVNVDGLPVSDVIQIWLDVSRHPARGKEQADVIYRRVIKPMVGRANDFS